MVIQVVDLEVRGVYRLRSRNLGIGVWTGEGFIGIREKFGSRFLDTEYPNTAVALERLDIELDSRIQLRTGYPSSCYYCGYPVDFSEGLGWQHGVGEDCENLRSVGRTYAPLMAALNEIETGQPRPYQGD